MKVCKKCGAILKENVLFCTECGTKTQEESFQENKKEEILANVKRAVVNKRIMLMLIVAIESVIAIISYISIKIYAIVTRAILYCSTTLLAQVETEFTIPHYDALKKVYYIWLCFNSPKKIGNTISRYSISKEGLLGSLDVDCSAYDKFEIVQICLNENEYNIPIKDSFGEEIQQMYNLSEGIEQRGIEKGIQQGIQQGIRQMVLNALQSNSIEDVSRILLLPIEEVEKIANENK